MHGLFDQKIPKAAIALCLVIMAFPAWAQKLPDAQESGLRVPPGLKIDGKTAEWDIPFQAFNKKTELFYSIANDKENLYLAVRCAEPSVINKIIAGGITFSINTTGSRKQKDGASVLFPLPSKAGLKTRLVGVKTAVKDEGANSRNPALRKQADSLMYVFNRRYIDNLKELRIGGIASIADSVLSIYNEEGIKARALFDGKGAYNYELAIPLKYLDGPGVLGYSYNIRLNGIDMNAIPPEAITAVHVNKDGSGGPGGIQVLGPGGMDFQVLMSATDFWGKYIPVN